MRNFIDIVSDSAPSHETGFMILLEGKQYLDMFSWLDAILAKYHLDSNGVLPVRQLLASAKDVCKTLQRADRQMWAARIFRLYIVATLQTWEKRMVNLCYQGDDAVAPPEFYDSFHKDVSTGLAKYINEYTKLLGHTPDITKLLSQNPINIIKGKWINHFAGIEYSKIQNYQFDHRKGLDETFNDLRLLEDEYKEKITGLITNEADDQIIKKFPDGYVWVLLSRGYCRKEADAMGHCGNVGARADDRIISLRRFNETLDGVDYYNACLTFILQSDGFLGEMKGRANEKPAERYHPFIVELLKMDLIKGIRGGGYAPSNNFALADLSEDQRDALLDEKPELGGFVLRLKKLGDTPDLRKALLESFKELTQQPFYDQDLLVAVPWEDMEDFVESLAADETTKNLAKDNAFDHWHFDTSHIDENAVVGFYDELPLQYRIKLAAHARNLIENEGDADELEDFDESSASDVVEALSSHDDDAFDAMKSAISEGNRLGCEAEAHNALVSAITSAFESIVHGTIDAQTYERSDGKTGYSWDTPIKIVLTIPEACSLVDSKVTDIDEYEYESPNIAEAFWDNYDGDVLKVSEPYYGWSDYDEAGAIETFIDHHGTEIEGFDEIEREEHMPDFPNMDKNQLIDWLNTLYAKIPDGFIRKIAPAAIDDSKLAAVVTGLWNQYYNKK